LKGMFFDTFVEDELAFKPKCRSNGAIATYPFYNKNKQVVVSDQAAFRAATLSFIKAVGPALKSHGYYVMVNGEGGGPGVGGWDDDGSKTKNWMSAYAPYVSDAAVESFQQASGSPTTVRPTGSSAWWQHWDGWASTEAYVESLGVDFSGIEHLSCTNMMGWRYTRASFLMEWNRYTSTWVAMTNGCNVWNSVTAYNPGLPTGARTQLATGVWQRKFQNGTVVINTNATPVTVSVNSQSYTIGATDALLL
jgi:hypothetical protein